MLINVPVRDKVDLLTVPAISEAMARVESRLKGQGRLLVRYSGTEPLLESCSKEPTSTKSGPGDRRSSTSSGNIWDNFRAQRMVRLSVNVNKVATLRNSRGGVVPSVLEAVDVCIAAGAPGITVHPRADRRHITPEDTRQIAHKLAGRRPHVEFNVEGDPRPDLLALVREVAPDQCTLVPVVPGEITSHAGWQPDSSSAQLRDVVADLKSRGIRVSVFVDPRPDSIEWAAAVGADRVELYTEPYTPGFWDGD